ncbi:MAG: hypothetical protein ACPG6V_00030 [Flavobacteriales bacterium]
MEINLLVIRTKDPQKLKIQYEGLGFKFQYHNHGSGPYHFSSENNGFVFEIYPLSKHMDKPDSSLRMGLSLNNETFSLQNLKQLGWIIISNFKQTEFGEIAVVQDLDGRKVELRRVVV